FASGRRGVSLTPRGGGSDMTGGSITDSVLIDLTRHMNRIHEVTGTRAVAEPGVKWLALEKELLARGVMMPTYPASRTLAAVGGMVANNSGGEKSLAYGQTKDYVRCVRAVLADGNEYEFGPLDRKALNAKLALQDFEGEIYRKMYWLLEEHYDAIRAAKPDVSKNSSGYLLWEVWDKQTFNLAKLFCASQGTLGIITRVTFDLVPIKPHRGMLVVFLKDLANAGRITADLLKLGPEGLESFDDKTLSFTLRFLPDFIRIMGASNLFSLAWSFLPEFGMFLTGGVPKLVLLCEFSGASEAEVTDKLARAHENMKRMHVKSRIARSEREMNKYWAIRRESFNVLRHHSTKKRTVPFVDDVIVKPEHMPEFLPRLQAILADYPMTLTVSGHAGNGNFHVIPLMDLSRPDAAAIIRECADRVYDLVLEFKGSITAEHGDGLIRGPYVEKMFGARMYGLFRRVKDIFDPDGIFNPGKKIDVDWGQAMRNLRKN
ncbi:MAG TPA: FAD-binding oxidoreductase, partial [Candidatus Paceibacterota bacterium]|nr:FAD-binding oxidoreductase [Candidatus Paceibacterota bacterium]